MTWNMALTGPLGVLSPDFAPEGMGYEHFQTMSELADFGAVAVTMAAMAGLGMFLRSRARAKVENTILSRRTRSTGGGGPVTGAPALPANFLDGQRALNPAASWTQPPGASQYADPARQRQVRRENDAELDQRSSRALVHTDDALRAAEEELGFATAEFGEHAASRFAHALADAKAQLDHCFRLRQAIDDPHDRDPAQVRAWMVEIIGRCQEAIRLVESERAGFDTLREQGRRAPETFALLAEGRERVSALVEGMRVELDGLAARYPAGSWHTIADNTGQAADRLRFAQERLEAARPALDAGNPGAALEDLRAAEQAIAQAEGLAEAVDRLTRDLRDASARLDQDLAQAAMEASSAKGLLSQGLGGSNLPAAVADVENLVRHVEDLRSTNRVDPFEAGRQLAGVRETLASSLTQVRDEQARVARAVSSLEHAFIVARSQISATEDYIMARRGGVGAEARVKLAEAHRALDHAVDLRASDPVTALEHAHQADHLARQGSELARRDVQDFGARTGYRPALTATPSSAHQGAALGGILMDALLGHPKLRGTRLAAEIENLRQPGPAGSPAPGPADELPPGTVPPQPRRRRPY